MRKRAALTYDDARGWHVDLPAYKAIPGTIEPITPDLISKHGILPKAKPTDVLPLKPTVEIELPATCLLDNQGRVDRAELRKRYRELQRIHNASWTPPLLTDPDR